MKNSSPPSHENFFAEALLCKTKNIVAIFQQTLNTFNRSSFVNETVTFFSL